MQCNTLATLEMIVKLVTGSWFLPPCDSRPRQRCRNYMLFLIVVLDAGDYIVTVTLTFLSRMKITRRSHATISAVVSSRCVRFSALVQCGNLIEQNNVSHWHAIIVGIRHVWGIMIMATKADNSTFECGCNHWDDWSLDLWTVFGQ